MTKSENEVRRVALPGGTPPGITLSAESTNGSLLFRLHQPVRYGGRILLPLFATVSPAAWLLGALVILCMCAISATGKARAADAIIQPGDAVVTGFSGIAPAGREPAADGRANRAGSNGGEASGDPSSVDFFIDPNGASARIFALPAGGRGEEIPRTVRFEVKAGDVGQVFGVALDDGGMGAPSIYLAATSAFGLHLVQPASSDDAPPMRTKQGGPQAEWMPGLFGQDKGGGPGSIWKVDGTTGEVSLFANIPGNSGPGLGNIAYDKANGQFFVSDMDTGLIYRIGRNGQVLDAFDHGVMARSAAGLPPLPDDGRRADIKSPGFDSENPETWGMTPVERRVWGLAVHDGRLYYAVWAGPQVWSVSLDPNGAFGTDARMEFDVEGGEADTPVSDIVISRDGTVYTAQRGGIKSSYDFSVFASTGMSNVQRYRKDPTTGQWTRGEYAIGMQPDHRSASGGVDLGRCGKTLWSTGDALRGLSDQPGQSQEGGQFQQTGQPRQGMQSQPSGLPVIHGLQGSPLDMLRPANTPPVQASFLDYDGQYEDAQAEGHVGSVRIYRTPCQSAEPVPMEMPFIEPGLDFIPVPVCIPGEPGCPIPACPPHRPHCCPPGTYWNGHTCCRHGEHCCPPGTYWNGRVCCPRGRQCCPPGSHWNGRMCCPRGQHCCPPGSHWNGRVCCPRGEHCCPPGTIWNANMQSCIRLVPLHPCREGSVFAGGRCIPLIRCPDGHGFRPFCERRHCPPGTRGIYPHCRKLKADLKPIADKPLHSLKESRISKSVPKHSKAASRRIGDAPPHSRSVSLKKKGPEKKFAPLRKKPLFMQWKQPQHRKPIGPMHMRRF